MQVPGTAPPAGRWPPAWSTPGGGSIGLAVIGTVAWSAVASSVRTQTAAAAKAGLHPSGPRAAQLQAHVYHHAVASGFSRGYLVSGGILTLILIIAVFMIRITRADLSGADLTPAGEDGIEEQLQSITPQAIEH